jgi:hypothetical protein
MQRWVGWLRRWVGRAAQNAERVLIAAECIGDGRFFIDRASKVRFPY